MHAARWGLVDIVRDFLTSHQMMVRLGDRYRRGSLRFSDIENFVGDGEDPAGIVHTFREVMVPGSALVVSHVVDDGDGVVSRHDRSVFRANFGLSGWGAYTISATATDDEDGTYIADAFDVTVLP